MIQLKTFYFNPYRECTYVLWEAGKQECVLIDAGMYGEREEERLRTFLSSEKLVPVTLLITHTHTDHVCGIDFVQKAYGISPIIFPAEGELEAGGMRFQVLRTPGHKEDSLYATTYLLRNGYSRATPYFKSLLGAPTCLEET